MEWKTERFLLFDSFFSFRPIVFGGSFLESLGNFSSPKSIRMKTPVQANKPVYFVLITDGFIM